jgi:flagellar assembly factor FliW
LIVSTRRFGALEVADDAIITFPDGLPGLEGKRFVLIQIDDAPGAQWLQSATDPDVALLIVDPVELDPEYRVDPRPHELDPIGAPSVVAGVVECRIVVGPGPTPGELRMNRLAPLLFNVETRLAMQLPLVGSAYSARDVWPPPPVASADEDDGPR